MVHCDKVMKVMNTSQIKVRRCISFVKDMETRGREECENVRMSEYGDGRLRD
jgi:hypothetical protein